jgi:Uma2 family endonuclease
LAGLTYHNNLIRKEFQMLSGVRPELSPQSKTNPFQQLLTDLQSNTTLLSLSDYRGVSLEFLNRYLDEHGPLFNIEFGWVYQFYIDKELDKLLPLKMVVYGKEIIVGKIYELLADWTKWHPNHGGRTTSSQGAFVIGPERKVVMPDVAYTLRESHRSFSYAQQWTYQGEPFAPMFVVEVDTLVGNHSQLSHLHHKMMNVYFPHGVELGWIIDPEHRIMIEYKKTNTRTRHGGVYRSDDQSWRDLSGGDVLPGFIVRAEVLDLVLNQEPGSSSEDEFEQPIVCPICGHQMATLSENAAHSERHREDAAIQKLRHRRASRSQ